VYVSDARFFICFVAEWSYLGLMLELYYVRVQWAKSDPCIYTKEKYHKFKDVSTSN